MTEVLPTIQADKNVLSDLMKLGASFFPVQIQFNPQTQKCLKRPMVRDWQKTIAFSIDKPEKLNGAYAYGFHPETIGAVVLDLDCKGDKDGEKSIISLLGETPEWLIHPSLYVDSPNGRHLFFAARADIAISRNNIAPGVDIRGSHEGGWLVAPGSVGWSIKRQEWVRYEAEGDFGNPPPVPEELHKLLLKLIVGTKPSEIVPDFVTPDGNPTIHIEDNPQLRELFDLVSQTIRIPYFFNRLVSIFVPNAIQVSDGSYHTGNYDGSEGDSCVWSPSNGLIKDFNDPGRGGDFLWWVQKHFDISSVAAAKKIIESLGLKDPSNVLEEIRIEVSPMNEVYGAFPFTDTGNAERFVRVAQGRILYNCDSDDWYVWDDKVWRRDPGVGVQQLAKIVARGISQEAARLTDADLAKAMLKWGRASEADARRKAMIACARSEPQVIRHDNDFDIDPYIFNTQSGVVDLKTGTIQEHSPSSMITQISDYEVSYENPDRFLTFIDDTFWKADEIIEWMHCYLGYCLTGKISEQIFPIWWGEGQNGKSVLLAIMGALMGGYAKHSSTETWLQNRGNMPVRDDLATLRGARFVWASEPDQNRALSLDVIKAVTGGDPVTCRHLYGKPFTYIPQYKLAFVTNHRPKVRSQDFATWRRLRFVPFTYRVPEEKKIPDLATILLKEEGSKILGWLIQGAAKWIDYRLPHCQEIEMATQELKHTDDPLWEFIAEECYLGSGMSVKFDSLWTAYMVWNQQKGINTYLSRQNFRILLQERGGLEFHTQLAKTYVSNIGLRMRGGVEEEE